LSEYSEVKVKTLDIIVLLGDGPRTKRMVIYDELLIHKGGDPFQINLK
jgi:hypothetical protein